MKEETEERVNHPAYYNKHPSGVECIEIVRHHNFNVGNAIKYLWRQGLKTEEGMSDKDKQIEDLKGDTLVSEGVDANYMDMLNYAVFCLIRLEEDEA